MGNEVDKIRTKLEKLEDALIEGRISEETYRELKEKYERKLRELQAGAEPPATSRPTVTEPAEAGGFPPGVQERLSPAVLAFVFDDEFFNVTGLEDGLFKTLRGQVQVALMVAATLLSLEADGHIAIQPGVRGRILKKKTVVAVKKRPFDYSRYGYLSLKIHQAPVGGEVSVYDLVFDKSKSNKLGDPAGYFTDQVLRTDLTPQTYDFLFYWEEREIRRSLLDRVIGVPKSISVMKMHVDHAEFYRDQATELRGLFAQAAQGKPGFFKRVYSECASALLDMKAPEGGY